MNVRRIVSLIRGTGQPIVHNKLYPYVADNEYERLSAYPRREHGTSQLFSKEVEFVDAYWYLHSIQEIFVDAVYKFKAEKDNPYIIDCGSNIGLSLIYFKKLFPKCRIKAFEADPAICELSRRNLNSSGFSDDVNIIEKAVWIKDGHIEFLAEGTLGGTLLFTEEMETQKVIKIPCEELSRHLNEPVDFLKLDIEGAELEVLRACKDKLSNVENLFVEFHGYCGKEQNLDELLVILKNAGFRYYIKESYPNLVYPFVEKVPNNYFDILLNIFCYRV
jgi:FkbM family methyltransferase